MNKKDRQDIAFAAIFIISVLVVSYIVLTSFGPNWRPHVSGRDALLNGLIKVSNHPGNGTLTSEVAFEKGDILSSEGIAKLAQKKPGTVFFCADVSWPQCPEKYLFPTDKFETNNTIITNLESNRGQLWIFNLNGTYWIGFKEA